MSDLWHYRSDRKTTGPISFEELQTAAREGKLRTFDDVRADDSEAWVAADEVPGLFEIDTATNDKIASLDTFVFDEEASQPKQSPRPTTRPIMPSTPPANVHAVAEGWFLQQFGQEIGPLEFGDLIELAERGQLAGDDEVRKGVGGRWTAVSKIGQLRAVLPKPVPAPTPAPSASHEPAAAATSAPQTVKEPRPVVSQDLSRREGTSERTSSGGIPVAKEAPRVSEPKPDPERKSAAAATVAPAPVTKPPETTPAAALAPPPAALSRPATPPAVKKPATPKFTPPKRSKPKREFNFDLSSLGIEKNHAIILGVLIVGALLYFFLPGGLFSNVGDEVATIDGLYAEFVKLRESEASEAEWTAFVEKARPELEGIRDSIGPSAQSRTISPAKNVYWAAGSFLNMLSSAREAPTPEEKSFKHYLDQARSAT